MPNSVGDPYYQQGLNQDYYCGTNQQINRVPRAGNPYMQGQQYQVNPIVSPRIIDAVQGDLAASIYPINYYPQEVYLIDADQGMIYTRSRDASGKLSELRKFKMAPVVEEKEQQIDTSQFVKTDEMLDIISEVVQDQLEKKFSEMFNKKGGTDK